MQQLHRRLDHQEGHAGAGWQRGDEERGLGQFFGLQHGGPVFGAHGFGKSTGMPSSRASESIADLKRHFIYSGSCRIHWFLTSANSFSDWQMAFHSFISPGIESPRLV